jgi:hypothetical protein
MDIPLLSYFIKQPSLTSCSLLVLQLCKGIFKHSFRTHDCKDSFFNCLCWDFYSYHYDPRTFAYQNITLFSRTRITYHGQVLMERYT